MESTPCIFLELHKQVEKDLGPLSVLNKTTKGAPLQTRTSSPSLLGSHRSRQTITAEEDSDSGENIEDYFSYAKEKFDLDVMRLLTTSETKSDPASLMGVQTVTVPKDNMDFRVYYWLHEMGLDRIAYKFADQNIKFEDLEVQPSVALLTSLGIEEPGLRDTLQSALADVKAGSGVLKKGYLTKKGLKVRNWKWRQFVLDSHYVLKYFKKGDAQPKGAIDFSKVVAVQPKSEKGRLISILVDTHDRTYRFEHDDDHVLADWLALFERVVQLLRP